VIPIGTLCIVRRACPSYADLIGLPVTVTGHMYGENLIDWSGRAARFTADTNVLAKDTGLQPIVPPRSASPVTTNTKHDEPVTA